MLADLADANLSLAAGLRGAEGLTAEESLQILDVWTERVRTETERHLYRFRSHPADYYNSEAYFRMLMMAVVLYEDFGVRYNPARVSRPGASADLGFFADSRDLFLHGLLGPRRTGTCSSMPVLYAAIGRRLGYPLKLVTTKAHLFLRWESETERFNLEATGKGMNRYDDDHFRRWPFPVSPEEEAADGYLKSLTPSEERALFLSLRAQCLWVNGRKAEALQALDQAVKAAPASRPYRRLLAAMREGVAPTPALLPDVPYAPTPGAAAWAGRTVAPNPVPDPNPILQVR